MVWSIPSSNSCKGDTIVSVINHPNWLTFTRSSVNESDYPRVVVYINIRLSSFHFSPWKDIIDHKDILLISFFNNNNSFWLINIYSDSSHLALKYLKDTEVNIQNMLIMTGDFNIWDSLWDPVFPHHSSISDDLLIIADFFDLSLLTYTNQFPIRYTDNPSDSNLVLDIMFLWSGLDKLDNHIIHPDWHFTSDHVLLTIAISTIEKNINSVKRSIVKGSEEEKSFIKEVIASFRSLNTSNLSDIPSLEKIVGDFTDIAAGSWEKYTKNVNITKHSKSWWDKNCSRALKKYRNMKRSFFDSKI